MRRRVGDHPHIPAPFLPEAADAVVVAAQADAKKATIKGDASLGVLKDVDQLYVAKGKRVVHVDLKREKLPRTELLGLLLGPTGNLRAPTLRKGRTLIVGFDESTYTQVLRQ